jgi:hypothetical protein
MRVLRSEPPVTERTDMSERRDVSNGRDAERGSQKPYEAPKVTRVNLRPEEAILGACKTASISGPSSGSNPCAFPLPCPATGS